LGDLLNLFNEPSVRLVYYMVVIVLSCAALFMAFGQRMRGATEGGAGRYATAAFGVVWAWAALMIGALAVIVTRNAQILPPLDRAVSALVILLIGWSFLTADQLSKSLRDTRTRSAQAAVPSVAPGAMITVVSIVLVVVIVAGYVITLTQASGEFNRTVYNQGWLIGTTAMIVLFMILTLLRARKVADFPVKQMFFAILLLAYGYSSYLNISGQLSGEDIGAVRLGFLAAMPIFAVVIYRFVVDRLLIIMQERAQQSATEAQQATMSAIITESNSERDAVGVLKALGEMLARDNPEDLPQQIVAAICASLKADVSALLVLDDAEYADVLAAYDSVQRRPIAAMALKIDEQPTLMEAIQKRAQRFLSTEKHLNELVDLYTRLDIQKVGPAYLQPLNREGIAVGVLVIALPYTGRLFRESETRLLESLAPAADWTSSAPQPDRARRCHSAFDCRKRAVWRRAGTAGQRGAC
jgi:hypothetical protein